MKLLKRLVLIASIFIFAFSGKAQISNALNFDGVDDAVSLPANLNQPVGAYTLQAWIKTSDGSGVRAIVVRPLVHGLFLQNNQLAFYNWVNGQFSVVPVALNDNLWHHIAVTFTHGVANSGIFYIDGVAASPTFTPGSTSLNNNYGIGHSQNGQLFNGSIDNVTIHNRILTPAEIYSSFKECAVTSTNLLANYNFNQGVAEGNNTGVTTLSDQSGNNNNGTLLNFELNGLTSNWVNGKVCCFSSQNILGTTAYCLGQTINLNASFVTLSGQSISGYQWKKNGVNLTNGGNVSGATSSNLQITNIVSSDFDTYSVEVTSTCGVGIYSVNITESGIINISNLTAYYPFNNGSSTDAGGNNYIATATATTSVNNRFNQANAAFSFNGISSNVTISDAAGAQAILNNGHNKSISLWFKRSSLSSKGILLSYQQKSPGNWNPLAYIGSDGVLRGWMYQGGSAPWTSNTTIDTNWHHLALVYTTNTQTAFLDGSQVATMNGTLIPGASNIIQIGNGHANAIPGISLAGNQPFSGVIDEVRFYNAVLSPAEINAIRRSPFLITNQPQNQSICLGGTASLSLNAQTIVGNTLTYQWTFNGSPLSNGGSISGANTNNLQIANVQASNAGTYNCIVSPGCNEVTSSSVTISVGTGNVNITQQPLSTSVCQNSSASFTIATQGATVTYQWKKNGVNISGATNATLNLTNVNSSNAGNYTVDIFGSSCGTITSQIATLTVLALPVAAITPVSPSICQGQAITLTASGGSSYVWGNSLGTGDTKTITPSSTTTYSVTATDANGCQASTSQTVTVSNSPAPTGSTVQTFCNTATVANLIATGSGIQWYSSSTGGTALATGTTLTSGTTYYASQTISGCESINRLAVAVNFNITSAPTGSATQTLCSGSIVGDLFATGTNIQWYSTASGGSQIAPSTALVNGMIYYASQTINSCESATRLAVTVAFGIPSAPTGSASQTICNSGTVANLVASGSNILWYAAETGGSVLSTGTTLVNGTTYYASQKPGGCESTDRFAVLVTINTPASPTGTASQTFCNSAMVTNLMATGSGIQWYAASTGGTALTTGTALATGTTYYATQTISGCESINRLAVTVTIDNIPVNITGTTVYCQGQTMNLTASFVVKSGESITGYQWKKNGVNLTNGGNISGATSANLQVANIVSSDFGSYSVNVTSTCGVGFYSVNITESGVVNISNLTAYYPFNNGSSDDASGNNYNATGSAITSVKNRFNQANSAFSFNGTSSTVKIAAPTGQTILGNGQNKSISLWFKRSSTSSKGILIGYEQASPGNWNPLAYIGSDGVLRGWMYQGGDATWTSGITVDTTWHHLALVYTTNTQTAYLDGSQVATMNGTLIPGASNIIQIGNGYANTGIVGISTTGNQPFSGLIDEVRFYNAVLSLAEINELRTSPFLITTQPQNQSVCSGETANLSLNVKTPNMGSTFAYQWTFNGTPLSDGGSITGANTNNLQISKTQASNVGTYNCILSPGCNEATSASVTLTLNELNANVVQSGITLTATQSGANYKWVNCNNGNQPIAGANGQSFTPTVNGSYAVEIVLNSCSAISSCVQISSVGLKEDKLDLLTIQPNPTSGLLMITVSQPTNAVVSAANGIVIATLKLEGETVLDATKFAAGVYYLRTQDGQTLKFIKQ